MRINRSASEIRISYSFNSICCLFLFSAISYLGPRVSLTTGLTILAFGITNGLYSWIALGLKLGICPNFYHSTFCIPSLKRESIRFVSSKVLECGIINGLIGSAYLFCWVNSDSFLFLLGLNLLSYISIVITKDTYYISEFLGITLILVGNILISDFFIPNDYVYQIILTILCFRVVLLKIFKKSIFETRSVGIVCCLTEGVLLSIIGFYLSGFGDLSDILIGFIYSIGSYLFIEASIFDKSAAFISIFSLQLYSSTNAFLLIPGIFSVFGLVFLIIGQHIFRLLPVRINSLISSENDLNDSFI